MAHGLVCINLLREDHQTNIFRCRVASRLLVMDNITSSWTEQNSPSFWQQIVFGSECCLKETDTWHSNFHSQKFTPWFLGSECRFECGETQFCNIIIITLDYPQIQDIADQITVEPLLADAFARRPPIY
jgi:hypothetical protein